MPEILARMPRFCLACLALVSLLGVARPSHAAEIKWKGYDWKLTEGGIGLPLLVRQDHPALTAGKRARLVLPFGAHEASVVDPH